MGTFQCKIGWPGEIEEASNTYVEALSLCTQGGPQGFKSLRHRHESPTCSRRWGTFCVVSVRVSVGFGHIGHTGLRVPGVEG